VLQSFLNQGLYDEIRVFKSPHCVGKGTAAPRLTQGSNPPPQEKNGEDWLYITYISKPLVGFGS
jgi:diaminohydroxyphosphoribosylaminopyrimidine deaminase/5-amino-6-(5-phosphoribosylamino)uracil reductase